MKFRAPRKGPMFALDWCSDSGRRAILEIDFLDTAAWLLEKKTEAIWMIHQPAFGRTDSLDLHPRLLTHGIQMPNLCISTGISQDLKARCTALGQTPSLNAIYQLLKDFCVAESRLCPRDERLICSIASYVGTRFERTVWS